MNTSSIKSSFSLINNRKFKIFLFFLVLTSIIWLLIELSKTYVSTATFNVEYKNLPSDKLLQEEPFVNLEFAIKAPGFSLLRYRAKSPELYLRIDGILKKNNRYYILPNAQLPYLNQQLAGETEIMNVLKDTIFIKLGNTISKKVPVKSNLDVKFKLGFNYIEGLKITPDSVLITGPEPSIDSITIIQTTSLKLEDVYETIDLSLDLLVPNNDKYVILSNDKVKAIGKVDKFTEGVLTIPVTVLNEPEGIKINPFPKEVKVIYQVGLSNFNKINSNSFTVVFDYNQYKKDTLIGHLTPLILQKSEMINSLKVSPSEIEFLIQK